MTRWSCRLAAIAGMLAASTAVQAQCSFTLSGANVWTGQEFAQQDLSVAGDRFVAEAPADGAVVSASWLYVVPPLADAHNHNIDPPNAGNLALHRDYLRRGIFYLLNPNNIIAPDAPETPTRDHVDAVYAGGGVTGPGGHPRALYETLVRIGWLTGIMIDELPGRAFYEVTTAEETRAAIDSIADTGSSVAKLYLLDHTAPDSNGLSPELLSVAIAQAREREIRPVVHIATVADFRLAAQAGAAAVMHMPGHMPRDGYSVEDYMLTEADARLASENGMAVVPTIAVGFNAFAGEEWRAAQRIQNHNLQLLRDAGVTILAGADRVGATSYDELTLLRASGVFDATQLLNIATRETTRFIHPGRQVGVLQPGFEASFLMLEVDPRERWYFLSEPPVGVRAGEILFDELGLFADVCGEDMTRQ